MFHSVPGVPREKMERFAGIKITGMGDDTRSIHPAVNLQKKPHC